MGNCKPCGYENGKAPDDNTWHDGCKKEWDARKTDGRCLRCDSKDCDGACMCDYSGYPGY